MFRRTWFVFLLLGVLMLTACAPAGEEDAISAPVIPESPLLRYLEWKSGRIAYLGGDGNIYTVNQAAGARRQVTTDALVPPNAEDMLRVYEIPAWSPDGEYLAFSGVEATREGNLTRSAVFLARSDGSELIELYSNDEERPLYLAWDPEGDQIVALMDVLDEPDTRAYVLNLEPDQHPSLISSASRFFFDFGLTGTDMLFHSDSATNAASISSTSFSGAAIDLNAYEFTPGLFNAPAWSPSGEEALIAAELGGGPELLSVGRDGEHYRSLAELEGQVAFAWSPNGEQVAYIAAEQNVALGIVGSLHVIDALHPETPLHVIEQPIVGFYWSPDGRKLAYFAAASPNTSDAGVNAEDTLWLVLYVLDVRSGETQRLLVFEPTSTFLNVTALFDQYARSETIWSPDSQNIVITGEPITGTDQTVPRGIWVVPLSENLSPRYMDSGYISFWSPR